METEHDPTEVSEAMRDLSKGKPFVRMIGVQQRGIGRQRITGIAGKPDGYTIDQSSRVNSLGRWNELKPENTCPKRDQTEGPSLITPRGLWSVCR